MILKKNRKQLLQNPQTNNAINVHGSTRHPPYPSSASISAVASSAPASATTFGYGKPYSGPLMLDFTSQTIRHAPYEYSDLNKCYSNTIDTCTRKRQRKTKMGTKDIDTSAINPLIEPCLNSDPQTAVAANQSALSQPLHQSKTRPSDASELGHINKKRCLGQQSTDKQIPAGLATHSVQQRLSTSTLQPTSASSMCDSAQQPDNDTTSKTLDSNINDSRRFSRQQKNAQPVNDVNRRSVARNLSSSGLQSSSPSDVYDTIQESDNDTTQETNNTKKGSSRRRAANTKNGQPNHHPNEDESPVCEDLGDCNELLQRRLVAWGTAKRQSDAWESQHALPLEGSREAYNPHQAVYLIVVV